MAALSVAITLAIRIVLVLLFFPFSALDKIFNFRGALGQAGEAVSSRAFAAALVFAGLFVEIVMSLGIVTGIADRLCAFILAGYCGVTALLWKQFWKPGDFWASANGKGRTLFLGFFEEPRSGRRLPAYHLRRRRFLSEALYCPPNLVFRSLSHCSARAPTMSADAKPAVSYWHLWADQQGIATRHVASCQSSRKTPSSRELRRNGSAPRPGAMP